MARPDNAFCGDLIPCSKWPRSVLTMLKTLARWVWRHRKLVATTIVVFAFLWLNVVAYLHARAMTHFVTSGARTGSPESLSRLRKVAVLVAGVTVPKPCNTVLPDAIGLEFEVHRFAGDCGEIEAWFIPREQSRGTVLMFHGYASCKSVILPEAKMFHQLGYATVVVDFRACGGSAGTNTTIGVYEADDVAAAYAYVRTRWSDEPVILFGQSMGGAAVLRAVAVHNLEPAALVLECPFDRLIGTVKNRFSVMGLPSFPFAQLLVFWGGVQQGFDGFEHNPMDYAREVRVPTLLLYGGRDTMVQPAEARRVFENLAGAKRIEQFSERRHESYVAREADRWSEVVTSFLEPHLQP
jgi:alpha-beta hydrolase superfamily lysophospholipase